MSTSYGNFRISDAERSEAIATLSRALGEGRLTMDEFDSRCEAVARAQFLSDLTPLFDDLPTTASPAAVPALLTPSEPALYGADEIRATRRQGQRMRAGVFWLGTLGSFALSGVAGAVTSSGLSALPLLIIPTLFILLYVMKVGPDEWYTPSIRQLERRRRELVRVQQLEIEASRAHEIAAQRAQRRQQVSQLTTDAINVAQQTVSRFKKG
ncbi:DUF1707 domain-containing protein [uncultured Corynebacterium sp.]|uniref:DUF1707 SHOCT-like domain-containing protein n=2 Tax=Corynebacterium TaxID=1716 RepID=UPI002598A5E2|nr:DUF1707 domain-containing protein [uncultured Corynebacterium sp.]